MIENSILAPDIRLKMMKKMNLMTEDSSTFEDSPNGVMAELERGCKTVRVHDLMRKDKEMKEKLFAKVDSLELLISILVDVVHN